MRSHQKLGASGSAPKGGHSTCLHWVGGPSCALLLPWKPSNSPGNVSSASLGLPFEFFPVVKRIRMAHQRGSMSARERLSSSTDCSTLFTTSLATTPTSFGSYRDKSFGMKQRPDGDIEIDEKFWEEDFHIPTCQECNGILKPDADELFGFHSNTRIRVAIGSQMCYEVIGDSLHKVDDFVNFI